MSDDSIRVDAALKLHMRPFFQGHMIFPSLFMFDWFVPSNKLNIDRCYNRYIR